MFMRMNVFNLIVVLFFAGVALAEPKTKVEFRKPLAKGLPSLPSRSTKKSWTGKLSVHDGMMWKDDKPFFPIGYTTYGAGDKVYAQAVAMGCNAIHNEVGWHVTSSPGFVPKDAFYPIQKEIRLAGQWGLVTFPLLACHYLPGWFTFHFFHF